MFVITWLQVGRVPDFYTTTAQATSPPDAQATTQLKDALLLHLAIGVCVYVCARVHVCARACVPSIYFMCRTIQKSALVETPSCLTRLGPPMHAPIHSLTQPLTHALIHSPTHARTHSPIPSLTHPRTHALTHPFTHSPTHSRTHALIHSPMHSRTHALINSLMYSLTDSGASSPPPGQQGKGAATSTVDALMVSGREGCCHSRHINYVCCNWVLSHPLYMRTI